MEVITIKETNISENYNIQWDQTIGSGVNGDVYKCTEICTGKVCAVKLLPDGEEAQREVIIQATCNASEHIVPIYDVYCNAIVMKNEQGVEEDKGYNSLFVVMELMSGGELFDHLQRKQVSEEEAKQLVRQIVEALNFLHTNNIAHRDLKPENILMNVSTSEKQKQVQEDITLKLADFGYADLDEQGLTNALYTLYYVAPEVLLNDTRFNASSCPIPYDKKCDLWSLGVIAYIMLMAYPPFSPEEAKTEMTDSMYQSIVSGSFYYEEKDWEKYSSDAHDFVFSLLNVNPEERPCASELLLHPWFK